MKKHLEFDLVDTSGMSDLQLKEIPYTVVQTNYSKHVRLKQSNSNKTDDKSTLSSYSNSHNDKNGGFVHHNVINEALTNFSYPDTNSLMGLPEPLQPLTYYTAGHVDNFHNFNRTHHEHSDSGLGVEQECEKRTYNKL